MLYLVGGPPRTGKSSLALALMRQRGVPWLSTDIIRNVLGRVVPAIAELDNFDHIAELVPVMRPYIEHTIDICLGQSPDYLVEGIEFQPSDVAEYDERYRGARACFLGNASMTVAELRAYRGDNPWHGGYSDAEMEWLASAVRRWSADTALACQRTGRSYIDIGEEGFAEGIAQALKVLLAK